MNTVGESFSYCGLDGGVSQEGWLTSLDTTETSATEKTIWLKRKLQLIHSCGSRVILTIRDGCMTKVAVPIRCHSPLCPTCARLETEETLRRYKPILDQAKDSSRYGLFITFTTWRRPKDGDELREAFKDLSTSYRKLLDMRLGPRKRKWLREMFYLALEQSEVKNKDLQAYLFEEFIRYCEANSVQKFRDLIKVGVRRPEITYRTEDGWFNPHFHVLWFTDCPIPQVLLSLLWTIVSGSPVVEVEFIYAKCPRCYKGRKGRMHPVGYDLRADYWRCNKCGYVLSSSEVVPSFEKELIKYMTKFWEVPEDKIGEVLWGLKGMKKVMLHGVKLLKAPKSCPHCGREDCKSHPVAIAELSRPITHRYKHGDKWEGEIVSIRKRMFVDNWCLRVEDRSVEVYYTEEEGFMWSGEWVSFDLSIKHNESIWVPPDIPNRSPPPDLEEEDEDIPIELLDF